MAKVPGRPNRSHFSKHDFHLDLAAGSCTCPAGQVTHTIVPAGKRTDRTVANLTLVLGKIGLSGSIGGGAAGHRVVLNDVRAVVANAAANFSAVRYPAINGPL